MSAEQVAREHQVARRRLGDAAGAVAGRAWGQVDPDNIRSSWRALSPEVTVAVAGAQQAAAGRADDYLDEVLAEQRLPVDAGGRVAPGAFAGFASDGRSLATLLAQPAIGALAAIGSGHSVPRSMAMGQASLDMIVRTQVADAGRTADQVSLLAHRGATGYVRLLAPPSCSRCAILAGRWYAHSAGFQRHPRCDCTHLPSVEANAAGLATNPRAYFDSLSKAEQDRLFTIDGARAIRDGADLSQVVNARRGMFTAGGRRLTRESTTRFGVARPGRLMPEEIYREAGSRDEAIDLLRQNGYLRRVVPRQLPISTARPAAVVRTPVDLARDHARSAVGADITGTARIALVAELDAQARISPTVMRRLNGVHGSGGFGPGQDGDGSLGYLYMSGPQRGHMHINPQLVSGELDPHFRQAVDTRFMVNAGKAPLPGTVAHEYGHHVASLFRENPQLMDELFPVLERELAITIDRTSPGGAMFKLDLAATMQFNEIRTQVSTYGATSGDELMAEIWAEYSSQGAAARPHIRAIGEKMRELAERAAG